MKHAAQAWGYVCCSLYCFLTCVQINGVEVSSLDLVDIVAFLETETRIVLTLYRESSVTLL